VDKPVIFNFHGYPWLIHRLAYRGRNHANLHVRGYKEKGNINTPLELAINNQIDRFNLAIDAIDRIPKLQRTGAHAKEKFRNRQLECRRYAYEHGVDAPEAVEWRWPFYTQNRHKLNIQSPLSLRERVRVRAFKKFNLWRHKV
jgi:xylulose-5-phosphate/fructose-6-phosphate phosphoketolase